MVADMARIRKKLSVNKQNIIDAFAEMAKFKGIDRDLLQGILEDTLSLLVRKNMVMKQTSKLS